MGPMRRRKGPVANAAPGVTWEELCAHASTLPGVHGGICFGTAALYVRKRLLARLKEDGETVAIRVDLPDRDVVLEADPKAFYLTDQYRPYPTVLMRMPRVRRSVALELLERAWRRAAPKRLLLAHESAGDGRPGGVAAARGSLPVRKGREGARVGRRRPPRG